METYANELYDSMQTILAKIATESENMLQKAERSYYAVKEILQQLSGFMSKYAFSGTDEEILFFKHIKPKFLQELIYYAELYHIEAGKPAVGHKATAHYYKVIMIHIRVHFERYHELYNYWRSGKSHLDHLYFIRSLENIDMPPEYAGDIDTSGYTTYYCFELSKMQAFARLADYIMNLDNTTLRSKHITQQESNELALKWTDSKSGLIELAYALYAKGSVNNGNIELRQLITALEQWLQIDLGNYYGVFQQNIRIRKKNRTQYLDQLKDRLEMKMDNEDENPKF